MSDLTTDAVPAPGPGAPQPKSTKATDKRQIKASWWPTHTPKSKLLPLIRRGAQLTRAGRTDLSELGTGGDVGPARSRPSGVGVERKKREPAGEGTASRASGRQATPRLSV